MDSLLRRRGQRRHLDRAERTGGPSSTQPLEARSSPPVRRVPCRYGPRLPARGSRLGPRRLPARPRPQPMGRSSVTESDCRPRRPSSTTGGSGKGLAADMVAERLRGCSRIPWSTMAVTYAWGASRPARPFCGSRAPPDRERASRDLLRPGRRHRQLGARAASASGGVRTAASPPPARSKQRPACGPDLSASPPWGAARWRRRRCRRRLCSRARMEAARSSRSTAACLFTTMDRLRW